MDTWLFFRFPGYRRGYADLEMAPAHQDLGFESDIKPLFRAEDREAMDFALDLWSYDDVSENADEILRRLQDGSMPCDAAWPADRVMLFESWMNAGKPA